MYAVCNSPLRPARSRPLTPDAWPTITSRTLADQVYEAIRDRVLDGDLAPGSFAREQELSDAMGVSRTPVREALGRLASEGLLERIPHRGFRVPEQSFAALLDLYPIVSALELLAGRLAFPGVTEADLAELRELNRSLAHAVAREDADASIDLNDRFHAYIAGLADNPRLTSLLAELRASLRPLERWYYSYPEHGEQSVGEHDALVDALETGELERALGIFERNMALTTTALRQEREGARPGRPD